METLTVECPPERCCNLSFPLAMYVHVGTDGTITRVYSVGTVLYIKTKSTGISVSKPVLAKTTRLLKELFLRTLCRVALPMLNLEIGIYFK